MMSQYQILVKALLDQADLQGQLDKMSANVTTRRPKIKADVELSQTQIDRQIQLWQNKLTKMLQVNNPEILNTAKINGQISTLMQDIKTFGTESGVSVKQVALDFDNLSTSIKLASQNTKAMSETNKEAASSQQRTIEAEKQMVLAQQENAEFDRRRIALIDQYTNKLRILQEQNKTAFSNPEIAKNLQDFQDKLKNFDGTAKQVSQLRGSFDNLNTSIKVVNKTGTDFSTMLEIAVKKIFIWGAGTALIYGTMNEIRKGIQYIKDLNVEMTNIQIVTGNTAEEMKKLAVEFNGVANELAVSTLNIARGSLEITRAGYSAEETMKLLKATTIQSTLGNIDAADSTEKMIATLHGFQLEAKDAMGVVDKLISLDNSFATSTKEIATAMSYSSSVAKNAGLTFDQLAAFIAVASSTTRLSAETIGTSFKSIITRMEGVKASAKTDEFGDDLSQVETVLRKVGIELRDSTDSFRPLGEVIDDIAKKWNMFNDVQRAQVSTAVAGQRQANVFVATMQNYDQVLKAQTIETESAGLAQKRYGIYLDSVQASMNKFTAAWEKLISDTTNSDAIKFFYDFGTSLIKLVDNIGALNIALVSLAAVAGGKLAITVPYLTTLIQYMAEEMGVAAGAAGTLSSILSTGLVAVGILLTIEALKSLNVQVEELHKTFLKAKEDVNANREELSQLASDYEKLANKQNKTQEDYAALADIQSILVTKYGALKSGINIYTDAINGNSIAIQKNIDWMKEQAKQQAKDFLEKNKSAYDTAKRGLTEKGTFSSIITPALGGSYTIDEAIAKLNDEISKSDKFSDWLVGMTSLRDELVKQKKELQDIVIEYEKYQHVVSQTSNAGQILHERELQRKIASAADDGKDSGIVTQIKNLDDLKKATDDAISSLSGLANQMSSMIDNYKETNLVTADMVEQLKKAFGDDYVKALTVENGILKLNTDAIKELTIAKALEAYQTAVLTYTTAMDNGVRGEALDLLKQQVQVTQALYDQARSGTLATDQSIKKQKQAYQDLLKTVMDMIKAQKEAEKQALQDQLKNEKDRVDARKEALQKEADAEKQHLQDQLDGYKKIIDAEKSLLEQRQHEQDYQDQVAAKNKEIADIDAQLLALQFDNSESAKAKRLQLEADKAAKIKELNKMTADEGYKDQKDALDKELSDFEEKNKRQQTIIERNLKAQQDALDADYKKFEQSINDKIKVIDNYLKETGTMTRDAMKMMEQRSAEFYNSLIEWNRKFGDSVDENIIAKLQEAFNIRLALGQGGIIGPQGGGFAGSRRGDYVETAPHSGAWRNIFTGQVIGQSQYDILPYHQGGIVGGIPSAKSNETEVFARLLKGEVVSTDSGIKNFMNRILPSLVMNKNGMGDLKIDMPITIQGNADKSVLADIKDAVYTAVNVALKDRGIKRDTYSYSL